MSVASKPSSYRLTARSRRSSAFSLAAAIPYGPPGTAVCLSSPKVPSPLPSRRLTLSPNRSVTTTSSLPSPLKSASTTASGEGPIGYVTPSANVPSPLAMKTAMLSSTSSDTTRSIFVSLFRLPDAMPAGPPAAAKVALYVRPPWPSPRKIVTSNELLLAVAMSSLPSPLKSAAVDSSAPDEQSTSCVQSGGPSGTFTTGANDSGGTPPRATVASTSNGRTLAAQAGATLPPLRILVNTRSLK